MPLSETVTLIDAIRKVRESGVGPEVLISECAAARGCAFEEDQYGHSSFFAGVVPSGVVWALNALCQGFHVEASCCDFGVELVDDGFL